MRKMLLAFEGFMRRLSGQTYDSSRPDALSNCHTNASDVGIACLSVVVSFFVFGAVSITFFAIFEIAAWLNPLLTPVAILFGYLLFCRVRRLRVLRARRKAHAFALEEV